MEFDNTFEVPVPVDEAWSILMDIERIAPCVPGAELTEVVDENTYKGKISVKLGPVALTFNGQTTFEEKDEASRSAKLKAQGTDAKGRGGAHANVDFGMEPSDKGTKVMIHTNLQLSGAVAQYGRGVGMVSDLAQQIIGQFADNLEKNVIAPQAAPAAPAEGSAGDAAPADAAPPQQAAPVQVGGMGLKVLWNAIKRLFGAGT
ncbi:MAG: SRPBCC family protein [Rhodospirillaceae bacterium]|nr:SRPBCC family protein [Rhodospirillaceae bacterium]MBT5455147.1 SRPBCC family protein [Rhodospirillaceae bacterium]